MALRRRQFPPSYPRQFFTRDDDFLDVFWRTNLRDREPPGCGVALLCIHHGRTRVKHRFKNDWKSEVHAEELLITYLWKAESRLHGEVRVEIFQNYSPCGKCARLYCELVQDFRNHGICLKLDIHFVALYGICYNIQEPKVEGWYLRNHWLNVRGLKRLSEAGIGLKGFSKNTWYELIGRVYISAHRDLDRLYELNRAQNDSNCRDQLERVSACPCTLVHRKLRNTSYQNNLRHLYIRDYWDNMWYNNKWDYCYL